MITVTILTKNSERLLSRVLDSVQDFPETILLDTGSTDQTLAIGRRYPNVVVVPASFTGFGPLHNQASSLASHDWILSLDSDEVLSEPLRTEILSTSLDPGSVYSFPRHNFFNGRLMRGCGWYPDEQVRIYHRGRTRFTNAAVHEGVLTDGLKLVRLKGPVHHFSYDNIAEFLNKMQRYSDLYAAENRFRKESSPGTAIRHGIMAFFKSYLLQRGWRDGYEGFIVSAYNAQTSYYKYLKLYESNLRAAAEKTRHLTARAPAAGGPGEPE